MAKKDRNCLVLGGGGARGLSHLGVLQVLEREEVPVDCLVGTSVGAIVAAAYALDPDALGIARKSMAYLKSASFKNDAFKKVLLKSETSGTNFFKNLISGIRKSYVFSNLLRKPSIFPSGHLESVIADLIPDKKFEDARIPFAVPALDIKSGREVLLSKGSLRKAILASCSLPGFFPPVEHEGMLLADAGVIGPVPVESARAHFTPASVVAVDITSQVDQFHNLARGLDAILRVEAIAGKRLNEIELAKADVVIRPAVGKKYWSDFSELDQIVAEGIAAAEASVTQLRALVQKRKLSIF